MENSYEGKKILVLGLAKSGFYAAKLLNKLGAEVTVNDKKDLEGDAKLEELRKLGVKVITGSHPDDLLENSYDLMVKNPGITYENELVKEAQSKNIPIITEVEIASKISKAHFIGITGTNGKTTTTTIIQKMLEFDRDEGCAYVSGNIGVPVSQIALDTKEEDDLVVELSSFQLLGTPSIHPEIAVITNITEAHTDYHGSREAYVEAKLNLIKNQGPHDLLIYNADQEDLEQLLASHSKSRRLAFSRKKYLKEGVSVKGKSIYYKEEKVADLSDIFVKGAHNIENFLAAIAVAKSKKVKNESIQKVMREFKGVKHRTQFLLEWNGRVFYNDSKATNIEATEQALSGFQQPIILLAGGLDRGDDYERLIPYIRKNVKAVVVFGETAEKLKEAAKDAGITRIEIIDEMNKAVKTAYQMSSEGDVILLSPAAASWDQYKNFEVRGDRFIDAVDRLIKDEDE